MADMRNGRYNRSTRVNARVNGAFRESVNDMRMVSANCKNLVKKLRVIDFAIIDTALYLDAYPNNAQALDYYHKLLRERKELREMIEKQCGPLNIMGNENRTDWNWVSGPWPWEPDAN